jgi:UDP-glucose 4-epimerase
LFGETYRSWTAVNDIVAVFDEAIHRRRGLMPQPDHKVFNLGLDLPLNQQELFRMFAEETKSEMHYKHGQRRDFEMYKTQPSNSKFNSVFQHRPSLDNLLGAVKDVIAYHRKLNPS